MMKPEDSIAGRSNPRHENQTMTSSKSWLEKTSRKRWRGASSNSSWRCSWRGPLSCSAPERPRFACYVGFKPWPVESSTISCCLLFNSSSSSSSSAPLTLLHLVNGASTGAKYRTKWLYCWCWWFISHCFIKTGSDASGTSCGECCDRLETAVTQVGGISSIKKNSWEWRPLLRPKHPCCSSSTTPTSHLLIQADCRDSSYWPVWWKLPCTASHFPGPDHHQTFDHLSGLLGSIGEHFINICPVNFAASKQTDKQTEPILEPASSAAPMSISAVWPP